MADTFPLGSIPPLSAWEGEPLNFAVTSTLGARARFTKRAIPSPKGRTSIDEKTGAFTYEPSPEDADEFAVWIRARAGANEESQKVYITPHPQIPSDFNVIEHVSASAPDPTSRFYRAFSQEDADKAHFNRQGLEGDAEVMTTKITVSGVKLVIDDADKDKGSLYNLLKDKTALRLLTLCADEVVIRCELKVPGTEVRVHARELSFEDSEGKIARIDTTPVTFTAGAAGEVGLRGQKAGDVHLFVTSLKAPGNAHRIIANGAKGQDGRHGQRGAKGASVTPPWDGKVKVDGKEFDFNGDIKRYKITPTFVDVREEVTSWGKTTYPHRFNWPAERWPGNGQDAKVLPGRPGRGGDGGRVYTHFTEQLAARVELKAGEDGNKAPDVPPSEPGDPAVPKKCIFYYKKTIRGIENVNEAVGAVAGPVPQPGKGAVAPPATGELPKPGAVHKLEGAGVEFAWVHPAAVRAVIAYANDAYLSGHTKDALGKLNTYLAAVKGAAEADKGELSWPLLRDELAALSERIEGPYDYFGNPAGWVPMLSFQANYALFEGEMESAVRAMFLAYWIQNTQKRTEAAAAVLAAARKHLGEENRRALADYNAAELRVSSLETEMASIAEQIETTRKNVSELKETLTKQAEKDLKTEHALRASAKILGGVMQLIPVGQPVLGSIGKALTVVGDIDVDKPAASLGGVGGAFAPVMTEMVAPKVSKKAKELFSGLLKPKQLAKTEEETKADEKKEEFNKEVEKAELKKKVKDAMDKKEAAKESIIGGFKQFAVSEDDVKERLEKVLAETPAYGEVVKSIESLNERKKAFAEELHATVQAIDLAATTIINNQLAILDLRDQQGRKLEELNLEALQAVQDMGRRARERLMLYQYYLLKSYHYLMLEDMPGVDFRAQKLFDAFAPMVADSDGGMLKEAQFKTLSGVFEQELKKVSQRIIERYQGGGNKRNLTSRLVPLSPTQVETLNGSAKQVDLDLLWNMDRKEEDIRITDITVASIKLAEPVPESASNLSLDYVHDGVTKVRLNGRVLLFRSGQYRVEGKNEKGEERVEGKNEEVNTPPRTDIHWGTKVMYNPDKDKDEDKLQVAPVELDPEQESLLRHLIKLPEGVKNPIMSFRPGAWAKLAVKRSSDKGIKIKSLTLKVHYVFQPINDKALTTVAVRVLDDAQPYIRCDKKDANGRSDGVGSFLRTFKKSENHVTLLAPPRYGSRAFHGWRVDPPVDKKEFIESRALKLDLLKITDYIVEPVFSPVTETPVNDKGEEWPACPAGWVFDDWLFVNGTEDPLTIEQVRVLNHTQGYPPAVNEPQGSNVVKLSFEKLNLLSGESTKVSVCTNPAAPGAGWPGVAFRWKAGKEYGVEFDDKGALRTFVYHAPRLGKWVETPRSFDLDAGNRTITFARPS